jgi:hypothetical protein
MYIVDVYLSDMYIVYIFYHLDRDAPHKQEEFNQKTVYDIEASIYSSWKQSTHFVCESTEIPILQK